MLSAILQEGSPLFFQILSICRCDIAKRIEKCYTDSIRTAFGKGTIG